MNEKTFIVLLGPPASGKTSYRKQFCAENPDYWSISSDDIRKDVTGSESDISEDRAVWEELDRRFNHHIELGDKVILDTTAYRVRNRKKYIDHALKNGYKVVAVDCYSGLDRHELIRRNAARDRKVPSHVIDTMCINFAPPSMEFEGFSEIITINQK